MGFRQEVEVADVEKRAGSCTIYEDGKDEAVFDSEFVNGQLAAWTPQDPHPDLPKMARAAFQRALVEARTHEPPTPSDETDETPDQHLIVELKFADEVESRLRRAGIKPRPLADSTVGGIPSRVIVYEDTPENVSKAVRIHLQVQNGLPFDEGDAAELLDDA